MSSVNRSTPRGGKGAKQEATKTQKNDTKVDTSKNSDHNSKVQPTAEQMRIAQIIDTRTDEPGFKDKVKQVMDATRKTEDEVCTALHDCDNDLDRAVNMLLEGMAQGEWETSVKKKKSRQPVAGPTKSDGAINNRDPDQEDWDQEPGVVPERERSRTRGGGPPRMRGRGSLDNRGWRGRENKENERNLDDSRGEGYRRGGGGSRMTNGPGRSGRGGRGGGRLGPRTFQSRERQSSSSGGSSFPRSIDTWNNPGAEETTAGESMKMEKWGDDFPSPEDWDNEEYTGSLADTKVFTPSGGVVEPAPNLEPPQELTNAELSSSMTTMNLSSSLASNSSQLSGAQSLDLPQSTSQVSQFQSPVQVGLGTLNAAQSEYLSQLTGQASDKTVTSSVSSFGVSSASYPATSSTVFQSPSPPLSYTATSIPYSSSGYPGSNSYSTSMQDGGMDSSGVHSSVQSMPTRVKAQRPRVPPPSKIPSSAVEMPGDAVNSNPSYLDVQFGGLEFGSETSAFEPPSEQSKYSTSVSASVLESMPTSRPASNIDMNSQSQATLDAYSTASQKTNQSSITSQMSQSQKLPSSDSMLSSSEHKSREPSYSQGRGGQTLDMDKNDVGLSYSSSSTPAYQSYQNQKTTVTGGYQPTSSYSSASYSSNVVTSTTSSYPGSQSQMSYASTGSSYSTVAVPSSYQNSSYSQPANAQYQTGPPSYPSISQASAFPSTGPSAYQGSVQSVYGASTGLSNTGYASTGAGQYQNNYGTAATTVQQNHTKLNSTLNTTTKEAQYDATTTASSNLSSSNGGTSISGLSSNVNASPALGSLASTSQTSNSTTTKVTSSTGSKSGVVPNIPPGVPPILGTHQYTIMSQGGLPFYQQPTPVYSYEDVTLMQQRIPHMAAYYDMSFQAPTSMATGRDAGLASVAYSMSDGRFTRTDNNASPVPSTLSQQNASQAHTQPMLNASGLPPGYAYYFQGGMMPGSFQYGTPPIYPLPPATNAHGSATSTQYTKPGNYSSGYGTGYDALSQNQDFGKTGYVSSNQSQNKTGVGSNTGSSGSSTTDLSATMLYGKPHVALGKVNSYEKQGFHSGTPPPFNLAGSQSTPMAPGGAYAPQLFIPAMAPHQQHHSTTLMHQAPHQMDMRNPNRRSDTGGSTNQRSQSSSQPNKSGTKQNYNTPSYWTGN